MWRLDATNSWGQFLPPVDPGWLVADDGWTEGRMDSGSVLRDVSFLCIREMERQHNFKQKHLDVDGTSARAAKFTEHLAGTAEMMTKTCLLCSIKVGFHC